MKVDTTRLMARATLVLAASDHRDARTAAFAAALLLLWRRYQRGDLSRGDFETAARDLVDTSVAALVGSYAAEYDEDPQTLTAAASHFGYAKALAGLMLAATLGLALFSPGVEPPSDAMAEAAANRAAGGLWAMEFLIDGAARGIKGKAVTGTWRAENDQNTCEPCSQLDGQSWPLAQVPFWPGAGGPCEGMDACRCEVEFS